jgi:hypothetical protein
VVIAVSTTTTSDSHNPQPSKPAAVMMAKMVGGFINLASIRNFRKNYK